jgi:hypothetical protein
VTVHEVSLDADQAIKKANVFNDRPRGRGL